MQNFILTLSILLVVFTLYRKFQFLGNKKIKNVSAAEAHKLIKSNKDFIIIDVRTKQEFKSGHISGAKSVPVGEFSSRINELEKYKDNPVLIHCASGGRSPSAVKFLLKHNFTNIYHMNRGLSGWNYGLK